LTNNLEKKVEALEYNIFEKRGTNILYRNVDQHFYQNLFQHKKILFNTFWSFFFDYGSRSSFHNRPWQRQHLGMWPLVRVEARWSG
jgi:hypothetical protein